MENIKQPAYPQPVILHPSDNKPFTAGQIVEGAEGFTKLEKAALMIAAGFCGGQDPEVQLNIKAISTSSVHLAKAVIEEANQ